MPIERSSLMQMAGRAGRPGHGPGRVLIMTSEDDKPHVLGVLEGVEPVKSSLNTTGLLPDYVSTELCLGSVHSEGGVEEWFKHSLCFLQEYRGREQDAERQMREVVEALGQMGMVERGMELLPTPLAKLACAK